MNILQKTREEFANLYQDCIEEVLTGKVVVNDKERYIKWKKELKKEVLSGKHDDTFTFRQVLWYNQTGEMIPLLGGL